MSCLISLADTHSLTVYDATYWELALRLSLLLATLDDDLHFQKNGRRTRSFHRTANF
jgi:predicted nucleic acid-binding protein